MKVSNLFSARTFWFSFNLSLILNLQSINRSSLIQSYDFEIDFLSIVDDGRKITIEEKLKKYEGTFQIQIKDPRLKPNIPYNIDELIENNRKQNETVYINLGSQVRLKIFSLAEIQSNSGKKIDLISTF
jgi:hypothetical protein